MAFRYVAVHYPLNYNQAVNDVNALRQRIIKFLLPVCGLSIMFNVTKFFEATYKYGKIHLWSLKIHLYWYIFVLTAPVNGTMINNTLLIESDNQVDLVPILEPTALRTNPIYSIYFNWFRFIAIGVIPFALLVGKMNQSETWFECQMSFFRFFSMPRSMLTFKIDEKTLSTSKTKHL